MKVLVTGANGMVGRCLQDLVASYDQTFKQWIWIQGRSANGCDLTILNKVEDLFRIHRPDVVVHLAAAVGGLYLNQQQNAKMLRDNVMMNTNVVDCCHRFGVPKALFILSSCIFPANPSHFPMTEDMIDEGRPHPSNEGYAYAKRMLWSMVKHYRQDYGLDYHCLIPVNLYGPYDNFNPQAGHVIPGMMHRFHEGKDLTCWGTGQPLRQFLYAPDFAKVIYTIINEDPRFSSDMICAGNEVSIWEMCIILAEITGNDPGTVRNDTQYADGCMQKTVSDTLLRRHYPELARNLVPLREGLKRTYKWYLDHLDQIR